MCIQCRILRSEQLQSGVRATSSRQTESRPFVEGVLSRVSLKLGTKSLALLSTYLVPKGLQRDFDLNKAYVRLQKMAAKAGKAPLLEKRASTPAEDRTNTIRAITTMLLM